MRSNKYLFSTCLFAALAVFYVTATVFGVVKTYTPVPYWDMWDGFLDSYMQVREIGLSAFWAQHNEHRIALAKVLSWIDLKYFHGNGITHLCANIVFAGMSFLLLRAALRKKLPKLADQPMRTILSCWMLALVFSWIQNENFAVGFQTQFFMAQLLPLASFYLLYIAQASTQRSSGVFALACFMGALSAGTMASGVLALPIMFVLAYWLNASWQRLLLIGALALGTSLAFFHDYHSVHGHGSPLQTLIHQPIDLGHFVLMYMGSPVSYMPHPVGPEGGWLAATLVGATVIGLTLFKLHQTWHQRGLPLVDTALLAFLVYILALATATAGGRLIFGLGSVFTSRYTTPVILAWCSLLVLYAPEIIKFASQRRRVCIGLLLVPLVLLISAQRNAFHDHRAEVVDSKLAALALALNIDDSTQIVHVYPNTSRALEVSRKAIAQNLSVFSQWPFSDALAYIDKPDSNLPTAQCIGAVDHLEEIVTSDDYMSITGWLYVPTAKNSPIAVRILDANRQVIGYALSGINRPDVAASVRDERNATGFKGYIQRSALGQSISMHGLQSDCTIANITIPQDGLSSIHAHQLYSIIRQFDLGALKPRTATVDAIKGQNAWIGTDSQHTIVPGYRTVGSFIASDADTGSIKLHLHRGEVVYYRSGPRPQGQSIKFEGNVLYQGPLPLSIEWVAIDFSGALLPESFDVTLSDNGTQWGEWSAIGLLEH